MTLPQLAAVAYRMWTQTDRACYDRDDTDRVWRHTFGNLRTELAMIAEEYGYAVDEVLEAMNAGYFSTNPEIE